MGDLISRQAAITAIQKAYADTEGGEDKCAVWKNVGLTNALHIMQDLPSAQPEKRTENTRKTHGVCLDTISRKAAIDALRTCYDTETVTMDNGDEYINYGDAIGEIEQLPSAQPETHEERTETHACDLISRQAAIDAVADLYWMDERLLNFKKEIDATFDKIKVLPSAQPGQTDCEYCHEDSDGYVKPIEKNCHAFIRFGMDGWEINLSAKGWNGSAKIMYCPMCGRRLKHG